MKYQEIDRCRICGNLALDLVLNLGSQALTGVFPKRTTDPVPYGPLELVRCRLPGCGLVQLRHTFSPHQLYGNNYGYRSGLNPSMVAHLGELAAMAKRSVLLLPGDIVLDIGSNDGTLLYALNDTGAELVGMDPVGPKFMGFYPLRSRLIANFFSAERFVQEVGLQRAKIVTSIAMFYDLEDPLMFMRDVFKVLADDGVWVLEQSYLPEMVRMNAYDTVCHEHLEYYSLSQLVWMMDKVGFKIADVAFNDTNGGSFLVVADKRRSYHAPIVNEVVKEEVAWESSTALADFSIRVSHHRDELPLKLQRLRREGKHVLGYGASTKGNVMLQFCGITSDLLPFIAEVNPGKFGAYTPGTLIPIISECEARNMRPDVFMVLPWHFRRGVLEREKGFLDAGGQILFPLPNVELVGGAR